MSIITEGTVSVTIGSQDVTFAGSPDLSGVAQGHIFIVDNESSFHFIAAINNVDKSIVLSSRYNGPLTTSGLNYSIGTSSTTPENIEYPEGNDIEIISIFKESVLRIQALITAL